MSNRMTVVAAAALASVAAAPGRIFGAAAIERYIDQHRQLHSHRPNNSIAIANRHGGAHEHRREIARRQRQRKAA